MFNKYLYAKHRSENVTKVLKLLCRHKIVMKLFAGGEELKKVKRKRFVVMASSGIIKRALNRFWSKMRVKRSVNLTNKDFLPTLCERNLCLVRK